MTEVRVLHEVWLLDAEGAPEVRVPLGTHPLYVGRASHNQLVVPDGAVSGRHLSLWVHDGAVLIEDLASSNGTSVRGAPVVGRLRVEVGTPIEIAGVRTLVVRAAGGDADAPTRWLVRPVDGSAARAVDVDRFRIGPGPGADLRTPEGPGVLLLLSTDGELSRADGDDTVLLADGDEIRVGTSRFVVCRAEAEVAATVRVDRHVYPYVIRLPEEGAAEVVVVEGPEGRCTVTAPNRVALMTVLARQLAADEASGRLPDERGWCLDEDVALGIWGRQGRARPIKVELGRLRKELREAGLDGWCIEKRGANTRIRAAEVRLS